MESVFALANLAVSPFWLSMILAPRWCWTERLQRSSLGLLAPIAVYAGLVLPRLQEILPVVARPELSSVAALLATPVGATVAWAHFLAFDLFVGRWIYLDARARGLSPWLTSPLLLLALLLGPVGLGGYLLVRARPDLRLRRLLRGDASAAGLLARAAAVTSEGSRPLLLLTLGSLGLLAASLLLQLLDPRQVLGVSTWLKPAKFAASVALTAGTLALLLRQLQPPTRGLRRAAAIIAWLTGLELVLIGVQAVRGVPSHFNNSTAFDAALFTTMGIAITVVWGAIGYLGWRAFRQPFANRALGWGIRLGFLSMVLGAGLGGLMPRPTAAQIEDLRAGLPTAMLGAHAVGVPDGGPGIPVTGWSTEGGDLRIPHFVGMHGLQLLPLFGWWLGRRRADAHQARLVLVAGAGYLGMVGVTLVQALRGQSLLAPDGLTWLSLVAVLAGAGGAAAAVIWTSRRGARQQSTVSTPWAAA